MSRISLTMLFCSFRGGIIQCISTHLVLIYWKVALQRGTWVSWWMTS